MLNTACPLFRSPIPDTDASAQPFQPIERTAPIPYSLEQCVKTILELGELSPGMEANIQAWLRKGALSDRDQRLLRILADAIADGLIERIQS